MTDIPNPPIQEDFMGYFQSALPEAHIGKITLATTGKASVEELKMIWAEDPHVKSQRQAFLEKHGQPDTNTGELWRQMKIDLQLVMKAVIPKSKDIYASFIYNPEFFKYFRIFVVQNTSQSTYDKVLATSVHEPLKQIKLLATTDEFKNIFQFSGETMTEKVFMQPMETIANNSYIKTYSPSNEMITAVQETGGTKVSRFDRKIDSNGNTLIDIPIEVDYFLKEQEPEHLSYFVFTMLDMNEVQADYPDIEMNEVEVVSRIIPQLVLHNGQIPAKKTIFRTISREGAAYSGANKVWWGPVHRMPDGSWMTNKKHSPDSQYLEAIEIDVSDIQDFRRLNPDGTLSDTSPRGPGELKTLQLIESRGNVKYLTNDKPNIAADPPYFTRLYSSVNGDKSARGFFMFDVQSALEDYGAFAKLIMPESTVEGEQTSFWGDISSISTLLSLRVVRKRVKMDSGIDKLGYPAVVDYDKEEIPTLVAEYHPGVMLAASMGRAAVGSSMRMVNFFGVRESNANRRYSAPNMYNFSFVDEEINNATYGHYSYGVEIEILDGTVKYIMGDLDKITQKHNLMKEYYSIASGHDSKGVPYYNTKTDKFTEELYNKIKDIPNLQMFTGFGDVRIFTNFYREYVQLWSKYLKAPLSEGEINMTTVNLVNLTKTGKGSLKWATPGSLNAVEAIMKQMENLYKVIQGILDSAVSGPVKKEPVAKGSGQTPARFKMTKTRTIKITKWFEDLDEIVDVEFPPDTGYEFLAGGGLLSNNISINGRPGLSSLTPKAYQNRVTAEMKKYFVDPGESSARAWQVKNAGAGRILAEAVELSLDRTKYSYLTPGVAYFRDNKIALVNSDPDFLNNKFYDNDRYYDVLLKSLRYNQSLDTSKEPYDLNENNEFRTSFPIDKQKIRNGLLDLFAAGSCTVSSMKEFKNYKNPIVSHNQARNKIESVMELASSRAEQASRLYPVDFKNRDPIAWNTQNPSLELESLIGFFTNDDRASEMKAGSVNLNNSKNILSTFASDKRDLLPNQIKALSLLMTNAITYSVPNLQGDYANDLRLDLNKIRSETNNQTSFPFFYYNFYNINEIQVLASFNWTSADTAYPYEKRYTGTQPHQFHMKKRRMRPNLKSPKWIKMNASFLNNMRTNMITDSGLVSLCRQVPYSNASIGLCDNKNIDIQTYNEHFFIENTNTLANSNDFDLQAAIEAELLTGEAMTTESGDLSIAANMGYMLKEAVERAVGYSLPKGTMRTITKNLDALGVGGFRAFEFDQNLDIKLTREQAQQLMNPNGEFNYEPFPMKMQDIEEVLATTDLTIQSRDFLRQYSVWNKWGHASRMSTLYRQMKEWTSSPSLTDSMGMYVPPKSISAGVEWLRNWRNVALPAFVAAWGPETSFRAEILARIVLKALSQSQNAQVIDKMVEEAIKSERIWENATPDYGKDWGQKIY
jgi:hypothetical protein